MQTLSYLDNILENVQDIHNKNIILEGEFTGTQPLTKANFVHHICSFQQDINNDEI